MGFAAKTLTLTRKDLMVEARARSTLLPMVAFTITVVFLLAFSLPDTSELRPEARATVISGFLWITVLFAGLIGFARTFEVERQDGALDALLLMPIDRSALFLSKAAANLAFVALVEAFVVPVFAVLFSADLGSAWAVLLMVVLLVDLGFVAVGTLFSAIASHTRSRELILPVLALPALVPVFIAATALTSDLLLGAGIDAVAARGWFGILIAFDLVFGIAASILFEFAVD
jgi:heme exporter protein B